MSTNADMPIRDAMRINTVRPPNSRMSLSRRVIGGTTTDGASGWSANQAHERDHDACGGSRKRDPPEPHRFGKQGNRAEDDRDLEADFCDIEECRPAGRRLRFGVEMLARFPDFLGS